METYAEGALREWGWKVVDYLQEALWAEKEGPNVLKTAKRSVFIAGVAEPVEHWEPWKGGKEA